MREKSDVEQKLLLSELLADAQLVEFRRVLREADVGRHLPAALRPAANAETFSVEDCPISRVICPDGSVHPDLPPVTIYMPIDAHRTTWDGSQPTITAPIAGDQWDWVIARAPGGVDVSIHTDSIPPLHTWVITPLEAPAEVRADGQPGAPVFTRTLPLREYISHMRAERSFEHRLLGRPEFRFYVASGFTCEMTWEGYCKWKANRNSAYYGRIDIPESMWSAGERANQAFRPVPGRLELVNWNAVPTNPMFGIPDVLVPKEPVTVLCMERDFGFNKVKAESKVYSGAHYVAKFKLEVDGKSGDDFCGMHVMFPHGTGLAALPSFSQTIPMSASAPAGTSLGVQWYGFGVSIP